MKSKLVVAVLMLALPVLANAERYGHHGNHHGHGDYWIAPAIIGGAIVGSAIYEATQDRPPPPPPDYYENRPLTPHEIREEQLRQRELELERREHEYYEHQHRHHDRDDYDREKCREYYRDDGNSSYYSRNCWNR